MARRVAGFTHVEIAARALISASYYKKLEAGERRPRRSTLERIAEALASSGRGDPADVLLKRFLAAAPVAPESIYRERVERRRMRRLRKGRYVLKTMQGYCPMCRRPL